jgi:hypothetical protein
MQHRFLTSPRYPASLASDAASYAIEIGELQQAAELLEQGRALLWSRDEPHHKTNFKCFIRQIVQTTSTTVHLQSHKQAFNLVILSTHKYTSAKRDAAASCRGYANWRRCQALRIAVTTLIPSWIHFRQRSALISP